MEKIYCVVSWRLNYFFFLLPGIECFLNKGRGKVATFFLFLPRQYDENLWSPGISYQGPFLLVTEFSCIKSNEVRDAFDLRKLITLVSFTLSCRETPTLIITKGEEATKKPAVSFKYLRCACPSYCWQYWA